MGHSVAEQSSRVHKADAMEPGDLGIKNGCLGANVAGREIGNAKHAALEMGRAIYDVHVEVFRKESLPTGSLFFDALLLATT